MQYSSEKKKPTCQELVKKLISLINVENNVSKNVMLCWWDFLKNQKPEVLPESYVLLESGSYNEINPLSENR